MKKISLLILSVSVFASTAFAGPSVSATGVSNVFPKDNIGRNRGHAIDEAHADAKAQMMTQCQAHYAAQNWNKMYLKGYTMGAAYDVDVQRKKGPPISYRVTVTDSGKCELH